MEEKSRFRIISISAIVIAILLGVALSGSIGFYLADGTSQDREEWDEIGEEIHDEYDEKDEEHGEEVNASINSSLQNVKSDTIK